jgi:hypothetical protein
MPLRSPCLTLESVAARRVNARQSTGLRRPRGPSDLRFPGQQPGAPGFPARQLAPSRFPGRLARGFSEFPVHRGPPALRSGSRGLNGNEAGIFNNPNGLSLTSAFRSMRIPRPSGGTGGGKSRPEVSGRSTERPPRLAEPGEAPETQARETWKRTCPRSGTSNLFRSGGDRGICALTPPATISMAPDSRIARFL